MRAILGLGVLAAVLAAGCAAQTPVTTWGYSSWTSRDDVAAEASFDQARQTCLAQSGVRDPATVVPDSEQEREFLECMADERWCAPARPNTCD